MILAAGTGMRQGEVFGRTVDRLNLLKRLVIVDRQLVTVANRAPTLGPPKTKASVRTNPVPQVVIEALAAHLAAYPAGPGGLVFTMAAGQVKRSAFGTCGVQRSATRAC